MHLWLPSSLSANGERSLVVDLTSSEACRLLEGKGQPLAPPGWDTLHKEKPVLASFADISLYELHVRDFRWAETLPWHHELG